MDEISVPPPPNPGDKLFISDTDWWHNACLGFGSNKWDMYATGYKDAADIVVNHIVETRQGMDFLVYPVAFLYRHYIELRLKELLTEGQQLLDETYDLMGGHDIDALWCKCRQILEKVWPNGSKTELGDVGALIAEFRQFDKTSQSFRYPVLNDGSPTLPDLQHVNLRHLKDVTGSLALLLDGASSGIAAYLQDKHSIESDYSGY